MKAVILAGGGGTRLWPLSTPQMPKQFQKIVSDKTMLEETLSRVDFLRPKDIYLAINKNHLPIIQKLHLKIPSKNIIIEPALRDTAPCIGLAAAIIAKENSNEVMAVIYADHLIKNKKEFQKKLHIAEEIAKKENSLNIIEVTAKEPNTNYGYVKLGKLAKKINGTEIYNLDSFTEKPNAETAKAFIKSKKYLWNTGIYVWKAKTLLDEYKKLIPKTYEKLMEIASNPKKTEILYPTLEKISIDYAIMEKVDAKKVRIIKADLGWSDIGTFESIFNELSKSKKDNITRGEMKILDCRGCLIYNHTPKPVIAIGLKDIVIIDTRDGLLISDKITGKRIKEIK
jgi:mannose-1-phosphate guanylyltransferase